MALIACNECGREISDKAATCPHCGAPAQGAPIKVTPVAVPPKTSGCAWLVLIVLVLFLFGGLSRGCSGESRTSSPLAPPPAAPAKPQRPDVAFSELTKRWDPTAPGSRAHTDMAIAARKIISQYPNSPEAAKTTELLPEIEKKAAEFAASEQVRLAEAKWRYSSNIDPMTSKTKAMAVIDSENTISLKFPYEGVQRGTLVLRQDPKDGLDVMFRIREGQLMCTSYDGCSVQVRFDEGQARTFRMLGAADNSTEVIFFRDAKSFVGALKKAKTVRVQVTIYQSGANTFEFDVSGFNPEQF